MSLSSKISVLLRKDTFICLYSGDTWIQSQYLQPAGGLSAAWCEPAKTPPDFRNCFFPLQLATYHLLTLWACMCALQVNGTLVQSSSQSCIPGNLSGLQACSTGGMLASWRGSENNRSSAKQMILLSHMQASIKRLIKTFQFEGDYTNTFNLRPLRTFCSA